MQKSEQMGSLQSPKEAGLQSTLHIAYSKFLSSSHHNEHMLIHEPIVK